jgi:hypothetical protein
MQREKPPGPLRNGNPRGNPNAAPRCGARTRRPAPGGPSATGLDPGGDPGGHPCRSPAMANGRCRMHGGTSTGPRTLAGLNRLRAANTTHGACATSASRRLCDPSDPFHLHAVATVVNRSRKLLALVGQAGVGQAGVGQVGVGQAGRTDPDPAALLALLHPDPLAFRRRPRRPASEPGETPCNLAEPMSDVRP